MAVEDALSEFAHELPRLKYSAQKKMFKHFLQNKDDREIERLMSMYEGKDIDISLPISLEILSNLSKTERLKYSDDLDLVALCSKQLEILLSNFANKGGTQSGISQKLRESLSNLAISQFFGGATIQSDKSFIEFSKEYAGIGGIFESGRDTYSPVLRTIFAESQVKKHPAVQQIIEQRKNNGFKVSDIDKADGIIGNNYYTDIAGPIRKYVDQQSIEGNNNPVFAHILNTREDKLSLSDFKDKLMELKNKSEGEYYKFLREKGVLSLAGDYYNGDLVKVLIKEILSEGLEELDEVQGVLNRVKSEKKESFKKELYGKYGDIKKFNARFFESDRDYLLYLSKRIEHIRGTTAKHDNFRDELVYFARLDNIEAIDVIFSTRSWVYYRSSVGSPRISMTPENLFYTGGVGTLLIEQDGDLISKVVENIGQNDNLLSSCVEKRLYCLSCALVRTESGIQEISNDKGGKILYGTFNHLYVIVRDQLSIFYTPDMLMTRGSDGKNIMDRLLKSSSRKSFLKFLKGKGLIPDFHPSLPVPNQLVVQRTGLSYLQTASNELELVIQEEENPFFNEVDYDMELIIDASRGVAIVMVDKQLYDDLYKGLKDSIDREVREHSFGSIGLLHRYKIAMLYLFVLGEPEKALEEFRYVLEKREEILGADNPNTLTARYGVAMALSHQRKYDDALKEFLEVLEKREKILGPYHPDTLTARYGVAMALSHQRKYDDALDDALKEFLEVLEKREKILGPYHPDTFFTSYEIAVLLKTQGKYEKASEQLEYIAKKRILFLEEERIYRYYGDGVFLSIEFEIAMLLKTKMRYQEALKKLKEMEAGRREFLGFDENTLDDDTLLTIEYEVAMLNLSEKNYPIAFQKLEEVLNQMFQSLNDGPLFAYEKKRLRELQNELGGLREGVEAIDQRFLESLIKSAQEALNENVRRYHALPLKEQGCKRLGVRNKRDIGETSCVDSRDEEDVTKEEKEQLIKELFDTDQIRQRTNNVEFQDLLFKVSKQISKGEIVDQNIEALVTGVKDIDLSSMDPEIRDIVREMKNNIEDKEEIKNILRRSGVAEKIGKVAEGVGLAFTAFLVGKHIANGDVEGLSYDALNLWVMPKIGEKLSKVMLSAGEKFGSQTLKGAAPGAGRVVSNFFAFKGLWDAIKARKNATDPVDIKMADLSIATNFIFINADVPTIIAETMSSLGREVGVIGEFAVPFDAAISVSVIIISQFVEAGFEVEKLAEHIKLTDQEKYELYWDFFFSVGIPRRIEADKKANEIYEQYISRVVGQYGHYDRMTISLPNILVIEDKTFVRTITAPSRSKTSLSVKEKHVMLVDVELPIPHVSSDISRIIPHTVADYKVICGPLDKDIVEKIIEKEREKKVPVTFTREVKEWSLREYPKNVTSCDGVVTYQKEKDTSSPSKTLLYLFAFATRILADPEYDLVIHFTGKIITSYLKDSSVHGVHERHGTTHRYYFADQLLHCSVHNRMTNFFYITEKDNFFCSLQGSSDGQRNTVVTQGNFTDFENIHSVIGNNKTNYITISHANYVDGKGGGDVITANSSAIIRGYFGDSIHGNGLALLPMNFSDIDKMTYANNVTNIYNEGGEFISIDGQRSFKTADGLFVTPVPIRVGNETNTVTNLHVIKRVNSNITLDDELNNLREIDNSNFDITKQLLCPNSTSIISNAGNNIFYPDKEHHNFYWEASSDMRHLYLIDQRNANITIAQANGMLNFSQLNSTLDDVSFIENEQGEMKFNKDGLHVTLLPDYKNVTVTFDGKEYYKLQSGKLERDYCSHPLKIDGSFSVNGTDLLNHYNCFTVDSNKVLFFKGEDSLLLVSGENTLLISAYYSSIYQDWNLSIKLNDRIIEPEEFRERADNPSALRYYRPDERGSQIYHNQPDNKYQIGLMDLKNKSILDCSEEIVDGDLILSLKNRPIIQIKNWNISQPGREVMFAFSDVVIYNGKCTFSNCDPEDIMKELKEEKARFYRIIDTPLLSALRKGRLDEFKIYFNETSIDINDDMDGAGHKLLHYATYFDKTEIAKFLLENNADINVRDAEGLTPLDVAKKYVRPEMVKILEKEAERRKDVHPIRHRRHKQHHRGHLQMDASDRRSIAREAENSLENDEIGYNKATSGAGKLSSVHHRSPIEGVASEEYSENIASSATRVSNPINNIVSWVKEKSRGLVSNVIDRLYKDTIKRSEGSKSQASLSNQQELDYDSIQEMEFQYMSKYDARKRQTDKICQTRKKLPYFSFE